MQSGYKISLYEYDKASELIKQLKKRQKDLIDEFTKANKEYMAISNKIEEITKLKESSLINSCYCYKVNQCKAYLKIKSELYGNRKKYVTIDIIIYNFIRKQLISHRNNVIYEVSTIIKAIKRNNSKAISNEKYEKDIRAILEEFEKQKMYEKRK